MKKFVLFFVLLILATITFAQAPQAFNYQAVVRDAGGNLLENQAVVIKISLMQGSATGQEVYAETHATTTNQFGQVDLKIGTGTVLTGQFDTIPWNTGNYYSKLAVDITGGTNYQVMGTTQMLSVPYALYAEEGSGWEKTNEGIEFQNGMIQVGTDDSNSFLDLNGGFNFSDICKISSDDELAIKNQIVHRLKDSLYFYGYARGLEVNSILYENSTIGSSTNMRYNTGVFGSSDIHGIIYGNSFGVTGLSYAREGGTIFGTSISVYGIGANAGHITGDLIGVYGYVSSGGTVDGRRWAGYFVGSTYVGGNLGILTENPTYPLTVNGTIRSKKVIVDTGWSDFVFEDDYSLMPLHQLDKFIEENKHLPEIPSAKEVEANGISLGEMDAKLLQKIEELTLYTIEQQKMIDELVKQNEELAKRVKKIEKRR